MNSKKIATKYISKKIKNTESIFKDSEIFESILYWSRDVAREYFATQSGKYFLVHYIDDVGSIVDEYLTNRATKMYVKAFKSRNKLFENLYSSEKTISWLIDRWINTFVNITSNEKYKDFVDITKIKMNFCEDRYASELNIDDILELERVNKFSKKEKIKFLKEVWKDAIYDDFDEEDMKYLCNKVDLTIDDVFENKGDLCKLNLKKEQVLNGGSQLAIVF
ncbi:hypothetical protein DF188_07815 [Aliarcobacter skirrowii]|uniref:Uncharacterized protein n=1 Tax=Aliarcobacter skirrowii TaxID=28200 RepID=A0A2U2BZ78_9BACT|nr:hypothetical protein DF188_07815 [Aliarcobacter skirrowii]